jgi:hypothetical protein
MLWLTVLLVIYPASAVGGKMRLRQGLTSRKAGIRRINLSIAQRIRFRVTTVVTTVLVLIVLSLMVIFAVNSTYPVQGSSTQSCKNMQTSIKIIDESGGKRISGTSLETLADSPFKTYVTTVSQYVLAKAGEVPQNNGASKSRPEVRLCFVYRPLIRTNEKVGSPPSLDRIESTGSSYLNSPWAKLAISQSPKFVVQGIFLWNERQFLLDQALLSGARAAPTEDLASFDRNVFGQFVQTYKNSVLLAASPEVRSAAQDSISRSWPVEVLWLFRNAWQSTLSPFSGEVDRALRFTIQHGAIGYTNLTKTIVSQFLTSAKTEMYYKNVLDLKGLFTLNSYRINRLH